MLIPPALTGSLVTGVLGVVVIGYGNGGRGVRVIDKRQENANPVVFQKRNPKLGLFYGIFTLLILLAIVLAVTMWTFNPITQAAFFGIGLGTLLVVLAEMISIYHYVVYSRR